MLKSVSHFGRASLGFLEAATSEFMFLIEEYSFSCVKSDITYIRYESQRVFVNVYQGRASFELNVEIGERAISQDTQEASFTIGDILYAVNPHVAESYRPYEATKPESVKKFVRELARLVKEYATPALLGDHACFEKVAAVQLLRSRSLLLDSDLQRAKREVEAAWREKDFKRIVEVYEPLKEHLTLAEAKKLEYAKKKTMS
jgi:hypothetical protein